MDEYIWIGAKTGKVSRMLDNGMAEFDIREGSYDLYKKCKPCERLKCVSIVSFNDCVTGDFIVEAYETYDDAVKRFDELHTPIFDVNEIHLCQTALIRDKSKRCWTTGDIGRVNDENSD